MTKKGLFSILILTCLVIIAWVIFNVIHTQAAVPITPKLEENSEPISPNFDQATLDLISNRSSTIQKIPVPNTTPKPATSSGQPASSSAIINR